MAPSAPPSTVGPSALGAWDHNASGMFHPALLCCWQVSSGVVRPVPVHKVWPSSYITGLRPRFFADLFYLSVSFLEEQHVTRCSSAKPCVCAQAYVLHLTAGCPVLPPLWSASTASSRSCSGQRPGRPFCSLNLVNLCLTRTASPRCDWPGRS